MGCFSIWGMGTAFGTLQRWMNLSTGCWQKRTLLHELGHALGLIHEHQRPDRDLFVTLHPENVEPGFLWLQNKVNFDTQDAQLKTPYDFLSIMHYDRTAFSKNGRETISPNSGYERWAELMGTGDTISRQDARAVRELYGPPELRDRSTAGVVLNESETTRQTAAT
jgi:hypothetical protein